MYRFRGGGCSAPCAYILLEIAWHHGVSFINMPDITPELPVSQAKVWQLSLVLSLNQRLQDRPWS